MQKINISRYIDQNQFDYLSHLKNKGKYLLMFEIISNFWLFSVIAYNTMHYRIRFSYFYLFVENILMNFKSKAEFGF